MYPPRPAGRRPAMWATTALTVAALISAPLSAAAADATVPSQAGSSQAGSSQAGSSKAGSSKVDTSLRAAVDEGRAASFFVVLKDRADLSAAKGRKNHAEKATAAYQQLRAKAGESQRSINAFLDKKKVGHRNFWIANAVHVTGDERLVDELAARPDVARIVKEQTYELDDLEGSTANVEPARSAAKTAAKTAADDAATGEAVPEWGVKDVKADQVWNEYGDRGEGIVIANIDSGVQFDHPDLAGNYRGNNGDGSFSHDYNWFDASGECPTDTPCDNNGHGTHTMGTMVGAGGLGVAPNATWIAAKGCESESCSDAALLGAGQWILAPTDHEGRNPRPDLAPHIVNNSWGGGNTTFYQDIVEAWNAAGIFEAFASGNDGDGYTCSTSHAPGAQAPAYGVGAHAVNGRIASFSGFGPSLVDGSTKPNISAPGVDVRSAWPGSTYNTISGTSMATPHVAGAVALLWSAAPSLIGDVDATRALLNEGAIDVDDTHCGGTTGFNNVWGEGKLDILASIEKAPHTAATVTGKVTDRATGAALSGVTVTATDAAGTARSVHADAAGSYRLTLAPGTYDFTLTGYGYEASTVSGVTLGESQGLGQDFSLDALPAHRVSGTVLDVTGKPLAKAKVEVAGTPVGSVTTAADGTFAFPKVAEGSYILSVTPAAPVLCNGTYRGALAVDGDETRSVRLPALSDASGNSCVPAAYSWIKGTTKVALTGDEDVRTIALPFPVKLYGVSYSSAAVTTNGLVNFLEPRVGDYANTALPSAARPNGTVAALWDDLVLDKRSSVQTATTGTAGDRRFAIVWNNAATAGGSGDRATFEAVFDEATGAITLQYQSVGDLGAGATVGIENQTGTDALQYSFDQPVLTAGSAVRIAQGTK
ncbi:S8 family serine peptidase [Streptomyces sp. NPDC014773]|uniref:S8 family serine peptidase n=1 Tax=Streptomyces sp. NPDC014773 TaxID=3364908 RepID=UPI0036F6BA87